MLVREIEKQALIIVSAIPPCESGVPPRYLRIISLSSRRDAAPVGHHLWPLSTVLAERIICFFLILLLPGSAVAEISDVDVSGYVKYLSVVSDVPALDDDRLYDQLLHSRIETAWYATDDLRGELDIRLRAFYGGSVAKSPDFWGEVKTSHAFANLDGVGWDAAQSAGYGQIDRLWLDYTRGDLELTLGRQRIAWGTALVWNVMDLFNPKSVLDFDYEEKPGADAVRMQYYTGAVSKVEMALQPETRLDRSTVAGLYSVNALGYDLFAMAGVREDRWTLGAAWAGSILDGGFRGEVLVSESPGDGLSDGACSLFASGKSVVSAVLSIDYTFSNTLYLHGEWMYNSVGQTENTGAFQAEALAAGLLSPARWSLYQEIAGDITPLTRATLFAIYNPSDHSGVIVPMLTYSLATNLDLLLIGQLAWGIAGSEYGDGGKTVTVRLKYSF